MSLEVFESSGGFTKIQLKPSLPQMKTDNSVHIADPCRWSQMRPPCQWVDGNLMLNGASALCWGLMWNPNKFSNFSSFVISFDCRGTQFKDAFLQGKLSGIKTLSVTGLGKEPSHLPKLKFLFLEILVDFCTDHLGNLFSLFQSFKFPLLCFKFSNKEWDHQALPLTPVTPIKAGPLARLCTWDLAVWPEVCCVISSFCT